MKIDSDPLPPHVITLCRNSFQTFCKYVRAHKVGRMHQEVIDELQTNDKHLVIILPRGHFKTTIFSEDFPLWEMWRTTEKQLIIGIQTSNVPQSKYILGVIMDAIENNPTLKEILLPDDIYHATWSSSHIKTKNGHEVLVQPFGRKGFHYDILISDDLQQEAATASSSMSIESIKTTFWSSSFPMTQTRHGKHLMIGTPISYDDLYSEFDGKPGWKKIMYPAVITDSEGKWLAPQLPEHFSLERLKDIRDNMPIWSWQSEYMLNPVGAGTAAFPGDLVRAGMTMTFPKEYYDNEHNAQFYCGHDVALSEKEGSDYAAIVILKRIGSFPLRVVKKWHGKCSEEEQLDIVRQFNKEYHFRKYVIEQKGLSYSMAEKASKDHTLAGSIEKFSTSHANKEKLIGDIRLMLENKMLCLEGDEQLARELNSFGLVTVNGLQKFRALSGHDDLVMALGLAIYAAGGYLPKKKPSGSMVLAGLSDEDLAKESLGTCPACNGKDVRQSGESQADGQDVKKQFTCNKCARMWIE